MGSLCDPMGRGAVPPMNSSNHSSKLPWYDMPVEPRRRGDESEWAGARVVLEWVVLDNAFDRTRVVEKRNEYVAGVTDLIDCR